jgi:hypothetical protein
MCSAATRNANGKCAHRRAITSAACTAASTRSVPTTRRNRLSDSIGLKPFSVTRVAPVWTIRPDNLFRAVIITMQPGELGNSGETCSDVAALSKTSKSRLPSSTERNMAARLSTPHGINTGGTPTLRRKSSSTSPRSARGPSRS